MTKKKKTASSQNYLHTIREGASAANIFRGATPDGHTYLYYELSRSWKALSSNREGYSKKFYVRNEEDLMKVISRASRWIEQNPQAADGAAYEPYQPKSTAGQSSQFPETA